MIYITALKIIGWELVAMAGFSAAATFLMYPIGKLINPHFPFLNKPEAE